MRLDRRRFLWQSMALAAVSRMGFASGTAAPVTVSTKCGALRGETVDGVSVFRGVPFARPPVGAQRFRATEPVVPWKDVRDATRFAPAAIQPGASSFPQSEDCLYLNVWTPDTKGSHPVFVWIHGGGYTGGRSSDPLQDGTTFARQGIVCVTIAYRLGVLGFLDLEQELGPEYAGSADNALRDVLEALKWIGGNIAAFGGDPQRVTVGGESAGAKLTDTLMGVPSATGLFQQMISESGGAERVWSEAAAQEVAKGFCAEWTAKSGQPAATLKQAPARALMEVQEPFMQTWPAHFPLRAEVDGRVLPQRPLDTIRQGSTRGKRLLLGTNRDESAMFLGPHPAADPTKADLGNLSLPAFEAIESKYRKMYPAMSTEMLRIRSVTAEEYWIPSLRVADAHVNSGGTAFVYRFDFLAASGRYEGYAAHASELRYVWDRLGRGSVSPAEASLAAMVHEAWCSFIRGAVPSAPGLPVWPRYSTETRPTMLLGVPSRVEDAPQAAEMEAWDGLLMH